MRWRIERDYLELKQELGLGHYEGRGWRGFHHHATLCSSMRIPDRRTGEVSPPQHSPQPNPDAWRSRRSSIPQRRHCDTNGTCQTRSRSCEDASQAHSREVSSDVPVVQRNIRQTESCQVYDAVGLEGGETGADSSIFRHTFSFGLRQAGYCCPDDRTSSSRGPHGRRQVALRPVQAFAPALHVGRSGHRCGSASRIRFPPNCTRRA